MAILFLPIKLEAFNSTYVINFLEMCHLSSLRSSSCEQNVCGDSMLTGYAKKMKIGKQLKN